MVKYENNNILKVQTYQQISCSALETGPGISGKVHVITKATFYIFKYWIQYNGYRRQPITILYIII